MAWLFMGGFLLYGFLIIFERPYSWAVSALHVVCRSIAVKLHILVSDGDLGIEYLKIVEGQSRFLLASAALIGLMYYWQPEEELFRDRYGLFGRIKLISKVEARVSPSRKRENALV